MAFQPVPNAAEVTLVFVQNGENITNTFHCLKAGGYTFAEISQLADLVDTFAGANLRPVMTLDCLYARTEVRGLANPNDFFDIDGTDSGLGTDVAEGLPNSATLSLKKQSGFTGRSARGRWYFIGFPVTALDANENLWLTSRVDSAIIGVEAVRNGVLTGPWTPVIVSRFENGLPRAEGITFPWISTVAVNVNVDSQRGRLTR